VVIKGGRLVDPSQGSDTIQDVAITNGKVKAVEKSIPSADAKRVVNARGMIVTPGWVDLHVHIAWGSSHYGIEPDSTCLNRGVTTALDLGSTGAFTFMSFRRLILERAKTRLFALLNISSGGMISPKVGDNEDLDFLDPELCAKTIDANRDLLLGVKVRLTKALVGNNGLVPLDRAREAADAVKLPLTVHPNNPSGTLKEILGKLKAGDVVTHCFHGNQEGILGDDRKIKPEVWDARQRGVLFDVGHGRGSFSFPVVEAALSQGLKPFSISSDLHYYNLYGPVFDQATTLTKFLYLGMALPEVIRMTTTNPAQAMGKGDTLGTLKPGAEGDVTICNIESGSFTLTDSNGVSRVAKERIVPVAALRNGRLFRAGRVSPCVEL
jgi:dihydroorotase